MASTGQYMLKRDEDESKRLDFQHEFMRALCHGNLLHPSIPRRDIRAVADMGTGTGVWLKDVAGELRDHGDSGITLDLVGFDISAQQFPSNGGQTSEADYVVHDITKPFPAQYHGKFDLVNLRFLVYALKEVDLQKAVENVVETLRPGGYLQWQEIDIIDVWATPAIEAARDAVISIMQEKIARSLNLSQAKSASLRSNGGAYQYRSMPTQMVKAIVGPDVQDGKIDNQFNPAKSDRRINALSWNHDLLRILTLETITTHDHPSPKIQAEKDAVGLAINCQLLSSGTARMKELSELVEVEGEKNRLNVAADKNEELAAAIRRATSDNITTWNADVTWIVAKKAIVVPMNEDWMGARRASPVNIGHS